MNSEENDTIQVLFQSNEFNKDKNNINELKSKCKNDEEFKELSHLKEILNSLIIKGCELDINSLDNKGNKKSGWSKGKKRGGFDYIPPTKGWKGFGINVLGKYDNGNNDWLGNDGNKNEWAIAYHGIGVKMGSKFTLEKVTNCILKEGFKPGYGQAYAEDDDYRHPGQKVGKGVYCSPDPNVMEEYANDAESKTIIDENKFIMGFMIRVKPEKIRHSKYKNDYWVLNGDTNEMRPYRILIKEKQSKKYIYNNVTNNTIVKGEDKWCKFIKNLVLNYQDQFGHIYKNTLTDAAIVSNYGLILGTTEGISIKKVEIDQLNKLFQNGLNSYADSIISLGGKKYRVIHFMKEDFAYLKINEGGGTVCKVNNYYIIGTYNITQKCVVDDIVKYQCIGICNNVVHAMAIHLKNYLF